jgi:hypothetical protein
MKENPFPSDGDAAKIPKFTDFLICLREDRKERISSILLPILERANIGEIGGNHDAIVVGEIGRGKTHLLKFLEKKLLGKKVRMVSDSLEIPNYNNILPVYVKFDASMTIAPEMFVYFFLNYIFGYGVENFGMLNSPCLQGSSSQLKLTLENLFTQRTGQDIKKPQVIAAQPAIDLMYEVCEEALRLAGKKSVLFLFDELEGIILISQKQKEESLTLVMDFLRQFHDAINQEEVSQANLYAVYAMTAPAYDKAREARQESGAWLSRLRSQIIDIPQFSEEELQSLVSCALDNDNLSDIQPFIQDTLAYIYRSVMGQPRFAIEALHNAYNLYLREKSTQIGPREVILSTRWLNPDEVIDTSKVVKIKSEIGQRYAYLVQIFSDKIAMSTISLSTLIEEGKKYLSGELSKERIVTDLTKFQELGYVEMPEDGEHVKVLQSFYNRILRELETAEVKAKIIDPAKFIEGSSETASTQVKAGRLSNDDRVNRLTEAFDRVLKQLFAEEGVTFQTIAGGWRLYETRKSPRGELIRLLSKPLVNSTANQADIITTLEGTGANAILFLYDFDDAIEEQRLLKKLKDMSLPEPFPWVKQLFKDSFDEAPDKWYSKDILDQASKRMTLSEICVAQPVSYGKRNFRMRDSSSGQVFIDQKGLWYSITEMARTLDPEHAQLVDTTLRYVIQDFFGPLRKEIIDKSSMQSKAISSLLSVDKKLLTVAKTLMRDEKCREAILKQQIIVFDDLPPGVNPINMNKLSESGLFSKISTTSWKANALNDAQQFNPWIRFIIFNSMDGKLKSQIMKIAKDMNLGSFEEAVLVCLRFYFELLESLELMKKDHIKLVDNKVLLFQEVQKTKQIISELGKKEFAGAEDFLSKYLEEVNQLETESQKIQKHARTKLEADSMYKSNLDRVVEVNTKIQEIVGEKRSEAENKQKQLAEMIKQADEEQQKANAICDSLDFNKSDSPIVKALLKNPTIKPYVLEIQLPLVRPHALESVKQESLKLEKALNEGFLMRFLSEYESIEDSINEAVDEARRIENVIKDAVEGYTREIRRSYERLLSVQRDFSPGPNAQINDMTADAQRSLSNKQYVDSLIYAGKAKLSLMNYVDMVLKKVRSMINEKKKRLADNLEQQNSYLENSVALLGKRAPKSDKSTFQKLEEMSKTISQNIESFGKFVQPDLNEKSTTEATEIVMGLIDEVVSKEERIDTNLKSFNENIFEANRSIFSELFTKALKFISERGEINSLNYSEFVSYVGDKGKAEEAIIELLEIGLARLNGLVRK